MAKLTDPDSLTAAVNATASTEEVELQTGAKTIELRVAGNLDDTAPGNHEPNPGCRWRAPVISRWGTPVTGIETSLLDTSVSLMHISDANTTY